ncbi:AraC family transcriptional regulator [Actinomyces ruminis]|uniref:AraC family transcriptional regulator n=1 Tax=Actinomyces ruminis TaxID=1937003 RepID=A0ABX4MCU5_9ACTO|nr:AraC family transcriptional regulator [Actinomyces ruminis]
MDGEVHDDAALPRALDLLAGRFPLYDWTYREVPGTSGAEVGFEWFGEDDEEVMVCVFRGSNIGERFHRHGFFFLNYAYRGDYRALSHRPDNLVTVHEGQMYAGQPFHGYALRSSVGEQCTIVGVLVRTQTFYREFLPPVMADAELLNFYLGPREDAFSDEFRHVTIPGCSPVRRLLEMMVVEYANRRSDSQQILKPLALALVELVAREWRAEHAGRSGRAETGSSECSGGIGVGAGSPGQAGDFDRPVSSTVIDAVSRDLGHVSLRALAGRLGYHPNYLSTLVRKETGKSFSQLVLQLRMERAALLVDRTTLAVEEIARNVGYSSTSNFYRAIWATSVTLRGEPARPSPCPVRGAARGAQAEV